MRRRTYLLMAGSAGALAVAGCLGDDADGDDPVEVVDAFWTTWEDSDTDGYLELLHTESSLYSDAEEVIEEVGEDALMVQEGVEWEVESREVIEEDDEETIVEDIYRWDEPEVSTLRITDHYILRPEDGDWRIYAIEQIDIEEIEED